MCLLSAWIKKGVGGASEYLHCKKKISARVLFLIKSPVFIVHILSNEWNLASVLQTELKVDMELSFKNRLQEKSGPVCPGGRHLQMCRYHKGGELADWLVAAWLISWLAGWLVGWLVNWWVGWLVSWLTGWLAGWLACWFEHLFWYKISVSSPSWLWIHYAAQSWPGTQQLSYLSLLSECSYTQRENKFLKWMLLGQV